MALGSGDGAFGPQLGRIDGANYEQIFLHHYFGFVLQGLDLRVGYKSLQIHDKDHLI